MEYKIKKENLKKIIKYLSSNKTKNKKENK